MGLYRAETLSSSVSWKVLVIIEVFTVGGWLTHGDYVADVDVDFPGVVEHRLIRARVWQELS